MRYQYGLPIYTQANNLANFDPSLYDPAQAVTIFSTGQDGNIDTLAAAIVSTVWFARATACRRKNWDAFRVATARLSGSANGRAARTL